MKAVNFLILGAMFFSSCDSKKSETISDSGLTVNDSEGRTSDFSVDGKSVTGDVTTQYFGDKEKGNFSVLCQHNGSGADFVLLQAVFMNEKDADSENLRVYSGSMLPMTDPEPGAVAITLSGVGDGLGSEQYAGTKASGGTISTDDGTLILKDVKLFTRSGQSKTVNAEIKWK